MVVWLRLFTSLLTCLHTYMIGHYTPFVRIIDLVSHTTYVVCVNIIQFKVDSKRQIFWETFHGNFISRSEFLPEICWEDIAEEILFACKNLPPRFYKKCVTILWGGGWISLLKHFSNFTLILLMSKQQYFQIVFHLFSIFSFLFFLSFFFLIKFYK